MNYIQPFAFSADDNLFTAWESVRDTPLPGGEEQEIFARFAVAYAKLTAMPRGTRRALQRRLARSHEFGISTAATRKLAASVAGATLLLALVQSAAAATITVNTNLAKIAADGKCSLVEAIINANNDALTHPDCLVAGDPGLDIIVLPHASAHVIPDINDTTYGNTRLPAITSPITIQGNGGKIQGTKKGGAARLIAVKSTGNLTLDHVTVSGGVQTYAGGIWNAGQLTISYGTITGNRATSNKGGGIYNAPGGVLNIDHSFITRNTSGFFGGGLYNNNGTVTITYTTITGNHVPAGGGGIWNRLGKMTIQNSYFSGNSGDQGGAIFSGSGDLTIEESTITKNKTSVHGGGIMFRYSGDLLIDGSTISANVTRYDGGGINCDSSGTMVIMNTTISGNKAGTGAGGVSSGFGPMTIKNSTVSGNSGGYAGGIYGALITVSNSTVTGNRAKGAGGIYIRGDFNIKRSVISGNKGIVTEIYKPSFATITVDNVNLFGVNGKAGVVGFSPGASDIVPGLGNTIATILSPLADNGGPTLTHALVPGSPAIDASPHDGDCPAEDQRGVARPQGALCDIGAFEKQ